MLELKQFKEYQILDTIYESRNSILYMAKKDSSHKIILKTLNRQYPGPNDLLRMNNEFSFLSKLGDIPGVINVYGLKVKEHFPILELEYFNGLPLKQYIERREFSILELIQVCIRIVETLSKIHSRKIIHKDISPSNILLNKKNLEIRFIDFGISEKLGSQTKFTDNKNDNLEGTVLYISPEQTGRVNARIDYRSDLYSLGCTMYHIFTGEPPFQDKDFSKLIFSHIARIPKAPIEIESSLPPALSEIILKLMSKNPEDRYQSANGLMYDLEKLLGIFKSKKKLSSISFPIGLGDESGIFKLSDKLYGREKELGLVRKSLFDLFSGKSSKIIIRGNSGSGKSSLVYKILNQKYEKDFTFLELKFEQFSRSPFEAVRVSLNHFCDIILAGDEEKLLYWKNKFIELLGEYLNLFLEFIPNLRYIIGGGEKTIHTNFEEGKIVFDIYKNIFLTLCQKELPLVLFMDDIQWADESSLRLINLFLNEQIPHLLFVASSKLEEDPVLHEEEKLHYSKHDPSIHEITISDLGIDELKLLVSENLTLSKEDTEKLSLLIFEKTNGNPFFVNELLRSLYNNKIIHFEFGTEDTNGQWRYDYTASEKIEVSNNVIQLMSYKIESLSPESKKILSYASCIGNTFDLKILSIINSKSVNETLDTFWEVIQKKLVYQITNIYDKTHVSKELLFRFIHDKVQQAVYYSIPDYEKKNIHYSIGKILLEQYLEDKSKYGDNKVYEILEHFQHAYEKVNDRRYYIHLAEMNLKAGRIARSSFSYQSAMRYFENGILLCEKNIEETKDLKFSLYRELAETAYNAGDVDKGDKVCREALELANTHAEKVKVFLIQMARLQAEAKYSEAMDLAKETLQYIGIIVPAREEIPELLHVYLDKIDSFLSNREVMSMMDFPNNEDELYHVTMQTFSYLLIASYLGSQIELIPWTITSMVLLCIENGNNEISPLAYVQYGFLMCSIYKDYTRGYEFGKLSIILSNQYQNRQIRGSVYYYFASQIAHWFEPLKDILLYLDKAFKDNIQSGNLIYADYTGSQYLSFRMISGFPLDKLYEEQQRFLPFSSSFNPKGYEGGIRPGIVQPMLQLLSLSNNTYNFDSEMFSEERYLEEFKDYPVFLAWFYHAKLRSLYLFEEWEELKEILDTPEIVAMGLPGTPIIPEAYFYAALGICNLYYELEENKKEYYSSLLDFYLSEFAVWSSNSPRNYSCKYYLILAEKAKMENKIETALFYYDKAVAFSRESEMIHIEALCMELQAKLWAVRKKDDLVIFYMQKAVQLYMLWSAKRKVSQLQEKYPGYQWEQERKSGSNSENTTSVLKSFHSGPFIGSIDFSSVLDASRAIAGEIVFTELLHKLIEIVMQNSGAESAFLLVKKQGKLIVEDYNSLNRLISVPCRLEEFSHLPHTIIYYVERTFSTLVLSDACREPRFMNDRYIQEYQPHSILCTPLMDRGNLLGIIYLENRITKGAFTQERVQVLELISSQAAISLENSLLYSSLEEKVEERTKSLQKALNEVKALKEQQDGDYFLISILTEPLGPNLVKSDRVNIEFFLKQKKSFQFHGEEYEIGGDINIAHSIRLQGKNCVVFLNGDAMGKSSQGAGGVLVLGTAFGVIIDRTKSSKWGERLSPSQWIANAFVEMHRVFLSFRGLMSMSAFLGIIDEESGTLYYISAEHPPPILYRNKKASFMEVNKKLRKLGTIGIHELEVKDILTIEQQLEKGDIIVSASDGREDVLVEDENGEVFMNSDETVFLRLLEDSSANIKEVVEKLLYRGEITDDLSILKVEYK